MKDISKKFTFKNILIGIEAISILVYLYHWIINEQNFISDLSTKIIVVCVLVDFCMYLYNKTKK